MLDCKCFNVYRLLKKQTKEDSAVSLGLPYLSLPQQEQACECSEDAQAAGYAQFEKVWAKNIFID